MITQPEHEQKIVILLPISEGFEFHTFNLIWVFSYLPPALSTPPPLPLLSLVLPQPPPPLFTLESDHKCFPRMLPLDGCPRTHLALSLPPPLPDPDPDLNPDLNSSPSAASLHFSTDWRRPSWRFQLVGVDQTELFYWSTLTTDWSTFWSAVDAVDVHFTDVFITPTLCRVLLIKRMHNLGGWGNWVNVLADLPKVQACTYWPLYGLKFFLLFCRM